MLGISSSDFWKMTPKEVFIALKTKNKLIENDTKLKYELTRLNIFYLLNIQLDNKSRMKKPSDLFRFSWEESFEEEMIKKVDEMTEDKWLELDRKFEKILDKKE